MSVMFLRIRELASSIDFKLYSSSLISSFVSLITSLSASALRDNSVIPNNSSISSRWSFALILKKGSVYVFRATMCLNIA